MEFWGKVIETLVKISPGRLLAIGLPLLGVALFPAAWRGYLGIDTVLGPFRGWFVLAGCLVCMSAVILLIINHLSYLVTWGKGIWLRWTAPNRIRGLCDQEKAVLARYVKRRAVSLKFSAENGLVGGLVIKGVLFRSSNVGSSGSMTFLQFSYNLQPWVEQALATHPKLKQHILKAGS